MLDVFATIRNKNKTTILLEHINIATRLDKIVAIYLVVLLIIL